MMNDQQAEFVLGRHEYGTGRELDVSEVVLVPCDCNEPRGRTAGDRVHERVDPNCSAAGLTACCSET